MCSNIQFIVTDFHCELDNMLFKNILVADVVVEDVETVLTVVVVAAMVDVVVAVVEFVVAVVMFTVLVVRMDAVAVKITSNCKVRYMKVEKNISNFNECV
jgi:hypothetical protein